MTDFGFVTLHSDVHQFVREWATYLNGLPSEERQDVTSAARGYLYPAVAGLAAPATVAANLRKGTTELELSSLHAQCADLVRTRHHEFGHALSCLEYGIPFTKVSIGAASFFDDLSLGRVVLRDAPSRSSRAAIEAFAAMQLAGPLAEQMGGFDPRSMNDHLTLARTHCLSLELSDDELRTLLQHLTARAAAVLRRNWRFLLAGVQALTARSELTEAECAALRPDPLPED